RLVSGSSESPKLDALEAGLGLASAVSPRQAAAPVVGALLETTAGALGAEKGLARALGSVGEFAIGGYQALGGPRELARTGKTLLDEGRKVVKGIRTLNAG